MMRLREARLCSRTVCGMGESKRQKGMGFSDFRPDFVKASLDVCPAHHHLQKWKRLGRKWMRIIPIFESRPQPTYCRCVRQRDAFSSCSPVAVVRKFLLLGNDPQPTWYRCAR